MVTHVTGPRAPVYLAGHRVEEVMFWVPQSGPVGLGVSIISYAGSLRVGFIADEVLLKESQSIGLLFGQEFNDLFLGLFMVLDAPP